MLLVLKCVFDDFDFVVDKLPQRLHQHDLFVVYFASMEFWLEPSLEQRKNSLTFVERKMLAEIVATKKELDLKIELVLQFHHFLLFAVDIVYSPTTILLFHVVR